MSSLYGHVNVLSYIPVNLIFLYIHIKCGLQRSSLQCNVNVMFLRFNQHKNYNWLAVFLNIVKNAENLGLSQLRHSYAKLAWLKQSYFKRPEFRSKLKIFLCVIDGFFSELCNNAILFFFICLTSQCNKQASKPNFILRKLGLYRVYLNVHF